MKRKILFLLVFILICCAGCSANYSVVINKDGTVEEKLSALEDEEFFEQYPKSSKGLVVSYILQPYLEQLNANDYNIENNITKTDAGVNITKKYSNFEEYKNKSVIYKQFTNEIKYDKEGKKVTISLKGKFSHSEQNQELIPVDSGKIAIELPYKVTEQNADRVNDNVYLWDFGEKDNDEREIKIVFDESKSYDQNYTSVIIAISIILVLLFIMFMIYNNIRLKRENVNKL